MFNKVYSISKLSEVGDKCYHPHYDKINAHEIVEYPGEDEYNNTEK